MRVLVFFDLPTETIADKKAYRDFRKFLIRKGFLMMQESVYCKLALNQTVTRSIVNSLRKHAPKEGLVQLLVITEKQYASIEFLTGEKTTTVLDSDERLVCL